MKRLSTDQDASPLLLRHEMQLLLDFLIRREQLYDTEKLGRPLYMGGDWLTDSYNGHRHRPLCSRLVINLHGRTV